MKILNKNLDQFKVLVFDLDGTLINSMPMHNKAWTETLANNGVQIAPAFLQETAGLSSLRIVEIVNERFQKKLDPKKVSEEKRLRYLKVKDQVEVCKPVLEIVKAYYQKKPLAIITGGSHDVVDDLLPKLKIDFYFSPVICADDTKRGKDTVEPYQLLCQKLSVSPQECLFFDDGDVGLKGATLAGMSVIHVDINNPKIFIA